MQRYDSNMGKKIKYTPVAGKAILAPPLPPAEGWAKFYFVSGEIARPVLNLFKRH